MMGCGCSKRRKAAESVTSYTLSMPDGSTSDHGSKLEAQAENVRQGGGGKVEPAGK
jgi:hypothetical protein